VLESHFGLAIGFSKKGFMTKFRNTFAAEKPLNFNGLIFCPFLLEYINKCFVFVGLKVSFVAVS